MSFSLQPVSAIAGEFLQCTFRGVPFAVYGSGGETGRRFATHDYPGHDGVWSEDMGRKGRQWKIRGLLVGPTCYTQRDLLNMAVERQGPGLLIHPSLGILNAVCVFYEFVERDGYTNVIDLTLGFVEQKEILSSLLTTGLHALLAAASMATGLVSASGYTKIASSLFAHGSLVGESARATMSNWAGTVVLQGNAPATAAGTAAQISGNNGRYAGSSGTLSSSDALDQLADWRAALGAAAAKISNTAPSPDGLPVLAQALITALTAGTDDATARIALLRPFCVVDEAALSPLGQSAGSISQAQLLIAPWTSFLLACLTLGPLAEALSDWQPDTATEGRAMLTAMAAIYDDFQTAAGNNNLDDLYAAIADLASKSLQDLSQKSAMLPDLVTISRNRSLPSLALAQQLYGDGSRADELQGRASPVHPAFMPVSFEAKSS